MITSLECAAQWLEHGKDPKAAAAEIRACLAKLDATPAAPVAELVPDPLSRRVERLLVELHAEGRLSEGQCAKMLNISRVDWRELAEFLAPATQAVAADGARTKDVVTREQVEAWAQQAEIETGWLNERFIAALGDFAIFARAAASPATATAPLNGIAATMFHGEGAIARCSYCGRYSIDPKTLGDRQPKCECGEKDGWSGSFEKPRPDAKWSGAAPATAASPAEAHELVGWFDKSLNQIRWRDDLVNADFADRQPFYTYPVGATAEAREPFQSRIHPWMLKCFGPTIAADRIERNHRFLEEALELVQSLGCTASEAHQLVDYTFGRPIGEPAQEVGGVMVTLAALCLASELDMHQAGETELGRISEPATVLKIRAKQAAKPKHSPLPQAVAARAPYEWRDTGPLETDEGSEA